MVSQAFLLIFGLLIKAIAAEQWRPESFVKCSTECPISGSPKLSYETGMTYNYAYSGTSKILLKTVADGVSQMDWNAQVKLTVLSPCDIAVSISNPEWGGSIDAGKALVLESYPLVVAMADGRVQHVCSHPDDEAWSVNLKKGVASAFQNSLPSNSSVNSGLQFTETDVVGKCPTKYNVEVEGDDKVVVRKRKNHRICQENYPTADELPIAWLKAPLPLGDSGSECTQEIKSGVITRVICEDKNVIRPFYGIYKYVETYQQSKLDFLHKSREHPLTLSSLVSQRLLRRSLLYDHETSKKDAALITQLDEVMKEVCEKTRETVEEDAASLMANVMHLLRAVPDEAIEQALQKIRNGHYCSSYHRLENLFLDALAFIREPGAVKVMVTELVSGKATRLRANLYTAAFFLTARPNKPSIESLQPLFESSAPHVATATLGAAVMVSAYCRHNPDCHREAAVKKLSVILSEKIQENCSPSVAEDSRKAAIVALKELSNIGTMPPEVKKIVLTCLQTEGIENKVRISAAHAFRNVKCEEHAPSVLIDIAADTNKDTEIRIASYLEGVRCANAEDLRYLVSKITPEDNEQVRGFILSHLLNLQESTAPHKENLRYHLDNIMVPNNFTADIRKYSRNIDMSYFDASLGLGLGLESNVIYVPGSFIPRSIGLNLTSSVGGTLVNMGEYGIRTDGLDATLRDLFGPDGVLNRDKDSQSPSEIVKSIMSFIEENGKSILEELIGVTRQKRSLNPLHISEFLNKIYKRVAGKLPMVDLYARLNDQEATYASFHVDPGSIDVTRHIQMMSRLLMSGLYSMANMNLDSARMGQLFLQYHLPTIQGIPVKLKIDGIAVAGLKMESHFQNIDQKNNGPILKLYPSFSIKAEGFIGYDSFLAENGIKTKNLLSSNTGISVSLKAEDQEHLEFSIDLPQKQELVSIESETYLMKKVRGKNEIKITPPNINDVRDVSNTCIAHLDKILGLKLFFDLDFPEIFQHRGLPLGRSTLVKIYFEKSVPNLKNYLVHAKIEENTEGKTLSVNLEFPGVATLEKITGNISYSVHEDSFNIHSVFRNGIMIIKSRLNIINQDDQKLFEVHTINFGDHAYAGMGLKMELLGVSSESKRNSEFNVYVCPMGQYLPESRMFETKLTKTRFGNEVLIEFISGTKNGLRQFLDFNFEMAGALQRRSSIMFIPVRLQKFEFHTRTDRWTINSFIHRTEDSAYSSSLQVVLMERKIIALEGKHSFTGTQENIEAFENSITGILIGEEYKLMGNVYNRPMQKGILWKIMQGRIDKTITHFEMIHEKLGASYKTKLQIDIPSHMKSINFENVAIISEPHTYDVEATLKHGGELILHYGGPVTILLTYKVTQLQTDISISSISGGPYKIASAIDVSDKEQVLALTLKHQEESLFAIEWKMATAEEANYNFHLQMTSVIDNKVSANISQHFVHLGFDNVMMPGTQAAVRSKGFVDVDFTRRKFLGELSWDADKDTSKKIHVEATVTSDSSSLRHCGIYGGWSFMGGQYHYKTEVDIKNPKAGFNGNNIIKVTLTTPIPKTLTFESNCNVHYDNNYIKVDTATHYKNTEDKHYELITNNSLNDLAGKFNYMLISDINFQPPESRETNLHLEARHQTVVGLGEAFIMMKMKNPSLTKPLELKFTLNKKQHSYNADWNIEVDTPSKGLNYEVIITPEGGLKVFNLYIDLTAISDLLETIEKVLNAHYRRSIPGAGGSRRTIYHFRYHQNQPQSSAIQLQIPSRIIDIEVNFSPSEYTIRISPNKGMTDTIYEFQVRQSHGRSPWNQELRVEGRFKHPRMARDMMVDIQYSKAGERVTGKVELDIFPDSVDKITGTISSIQLSEDSVKIEANISGRILMLTPKITLIAARSPHITSFDLTVHTASTQPPAIFIAGKLDQTSGRNMAAAFVLATQGEKQIDISGAIVPEDRSSCGGFKMTGISHSRVTGNHAIHAQLCHPGGIQVTFKNQEDGWSQTINIGMIGLQTAEVRVDVDDPAKAENRPAVLARLTVASPKLVSLDIHHSSEELISLKSAWAIKYSRASQEINVWLERMYEEIIRRDAETTLPILEMSLVWHDIIGEVSHICRDIAEDGKIIRDAVRDIVIRTRIVEEIVKNYRGLWDHLRQVVHHVAVTFSKTVSVIFKEFGDSNKRFTEGIRGCVHFMQTGEMPDSFHYLLEVIKESSLYGLLERYVEIPILHFSDEDRAVIKEVVLKTMAMLEQDFNSLRSYLLQIPEVQRNLNWILQHLDIEPLIVQKFETLLYRAVQESMALSFELEPNSIQVLLPLRSPAQSLAQAANSLSYNPLPILDKAPWWFMDSAAQPIWAYISNWPHRLVDSLPPNNRIAMLVAENEILTFDGAVLRAPKSQCSVLLLAYGLNSLTMQHSNGLVPSKLTLVTSENTIVIQPDGKVIISGREMSTPHEIQGNIQVWQTPVEIIVETTFMKLRVSRKFRLATVELLGWTFGQVAGLLGTYDGEVGNDWLMSSGTKANNLQELVMSWQLDQHCSIPPIHPKTSANTSLQKIAVCQAMLGIPSRCNVIVDPEPFIRICYGTANHCDAVQAYRDICSSKGVDISVAFAC